MKKIIEWILSFFKKPQINTPEFPEGMQWLGIDISKWAKTATCNCNIAGNAISLDSDKKNVWPKAGKVDAGVCNANAWMIFQINGQWYAATWEWLAVGQSVKKLTNKLGTYIKKSPIVPSNWNPNSGDKIGLFVSGLCRDKSRNVEERSNITWMTWP